MGDELVQVVIDVPKKLSREQQTLLRQYAETEHKSVAPESKKFFEKLVSYFAGEDVT
jgi:molecular chaperone DnaJ